MIIKLKRALVLRLALFKSSWQASTANLARQLAMSSAAILFTIASLISLKGIFVGFQTKLIGGYNYSELVFMFFIFQISYYVSQIMFMKMFVALPNLVNRGDLDLYLIRPAELKLQLKYQSTDLPWFIMSFGSLSLLIFSQINFSEINTNILNLPVVATVILMGIISYETIFFVLASSVFWFGEARRILHISFSLNRSSNPPMSASPIWFLVLNLMLLPISFATILGSQILLKGFGPEEKLYFVLMLALTFISLIFQKHWWRVCLKKYSSASS